VGHCDTRRITPKMPASKTAMPATTQGALLLVSTDCDGGRLSTYSGGT
jgi:hypothetical protein